MELFIIAFKRLINFIKALIITIYPSDVRRWKLFAKVYFDLLAKQKHFVAQYLQGNFQLNPIHD